MYMYKLIPPTYLVVSFEEDRVQTIVKNLITKFAQYIRIVLL